MEQLFSVGAGPVLCSVRSEPRSSQNKGETSSGNWVPLPYPMAQSCFQKNLRYPCLTSLRGLWLAVAWTDRRSGRTVPSTSQGSDPKQTGRHAGPGLHRMLAQAQRLCILACGSRSGPALSERDPGGLAAVLSSSFIFHPLDSVASFLAAPGGWPYRTLAPQSLTLCL